MAHEQGAKVTAHCFGHDVLAGLIDAGIDCIEHGTGLTPDLVERMVAGSTALVPTVMQLEKFPEYAEAGAAKFPEYAETMTDLHRRRRDTIMAAHEAGVAIYAGSDGGGVARHGNLPGEVVALHELGLSAEQALGAASWRAREWLGLDGHLARGHLGRLRGLRRATRCADLSVLRRARSGRAARPRRWLTPARPRGGRRAPGGRLRVRRGGGRPARGRGRRRATSSR